MITALQRYGNDTCKWTPPQTEREGYWGPPTASQASGASIGSKLTVPSNLVPNITVCADGCDYSEIQQAVESAPVHGRNRFVIYIKEGVYEEIVRVGFEKTNVVFLGDGMGKTVITGNLNAGMVGVSTYNTATVGTRYWFIWFIYSPFSTKFELNYKKREFGRFFFIYNIIIMRVRKSAIGVKYRFFKLVILIL